MHNTYTQSSWFGWTSSRWASENCQPSKVLATFPTEPYNIAIYTWDLWGSSLHDENVGLCMQLAAANPLDGRATLWSLDGLEGTSSLWLDSVNAGGLLAASGRWKHKPLSHYGFGNFGRQQFKHLGAGACIVAHAFPRCTSTSRGRVDANFTYPGLHVSLGACNGIGQQVALVGGKWADAASVDHFPDSARRNLEPTRAKSNSKPSMLPKARSRVAAATPDKPTRPAKTNPWGTRLHAAARNKNRVSCTSRRDIPSSDAQAPNLWTAKLP